MHFVIRHFKSGHISSRILLDFIRFNLVRRFTYIMCLMVCANNLFTMPSEVGSFRGRAENKAGNFVSTESIYPPTGKPVDELVIPAFQHRSFRRRREKAERAQATNSDNLHSTPDLLLNNQKYDCDHFPANVLPPIVQRKPCFLGTVPTRIVVDLGERIVLQCIVYNVNFSTVVISWWREGWFRELTLGLETYNTRYRLPRASYQDWSLQINVARPD
ncbi:hypothetical protein FGIG_10659 [Fasciola gigantica]|uniref:Ig-like domain-containing protein n=1 Tax=Fasciola gigantica TaxID=46835 RepID=A0A504YTX1_FASGI|nr:hypothetical protein FGIG_10659 [Fasciola gigantica]